MCFLGLNIFQGKEGRGDLIQKLEELISIRKKGFKKVLRGRQQIQERGGGVKPNKKSKQKLICSQYGSPNVATPSRESNTYEPVWRAAIAIPGVLSTSSLSEPYCSCALGLLFTLKQHLSSSLMDVKKQGCPVNVESGEGKFIMTLSLIHWVPVQDKGSKMSEVGVHGNYSK